MGPAKDNNPVEVQTMSVSPVGDLSGTSEVALQWQLIQDEKALAANEAAEAGQRVIAQAQADVALDHVNAASVADQQLQIERQQEARALAQAERAAQVRDQILASQDVQASQAILATQAVRASQPVQSGPPVEPGEEIQAIQASLADNETNGVDVLL
jgi:hypothetical protein